MLNSNRYGNMYLNFAGLTFLVTLLLLLSFVLWKTPGPSRTYGPRYSDHPDGIQGGGETGPTDTEELEKIVSERKASAKQIRPGSMDLSEELESSGRSITPDFHNLPEAYFMPEAPENARKATEKIRELQEAIRLSGEARKHIIRNIPENAQVGQ